jgi:hypothetical protein
MWMCDVDVVWRGVAWRGVMFFVLFCFEFLKRIFLHVNQLHFFYGRERVPTVCRESSDTTKSYGCQTKNKIIQINKIK